MFIKNEVRKNVYFDSVTLMVASSKIRQMEGISNAAVMMGTDHNRSLMTDAGLLGKGLPEFGPNDTVIGICARDEAAAQAAIDYFESFLNGKKAAPAVTGEVRTETLEEARDLNSQLNLAVVSVPGRFAAAEAEKVLDQGMHVLLFSDNVSLEDEVALKKKAVERGLLMMGPDCGTAIINGTALGFANAVRRGNIGLAAAAGTGLQEVTVIIDDLGGGITQGLGTGGRDLKEEVGGAMMGLCLDALVQDPETEVIVIISKPPAPSVLQKLKEQLRDVTKPVIAIVMGGDPDLFQGSGILCASDLEQAARMAVKAARGEPAEAGEEDTALLQALAQEECAKLQPGQRFLRGLYSGGTLCYESMLILERGGVPTWSNIAIDKSRLLQGNEPSRAHTLLDMGEDFFTNGMPHPMIDFRQRVMRMEKEAADPQTAVLLLDCVGGYGTHENPAGELSGAITAAREAAAAQGRYLSVIASVTTTEQDPQVRSRQRQQLEQAGAIVMPSNAQAARLAAAIIQSLEGGV